MVIGWMLSMATDTTFADTGKYAATREEVGNTFQTRRLLAVDGSTQNVVGAADNRPTTTCRNASEYEVRIGSAQSVASLKIMGFPILSSETFKVGAMTGAVSIISASASTATIICADGMTL